MTEEAVLPTPLFSRTNRIRTYLFWSFLVGVTFFAVYPTMNWLTSLRSSPLHLYLDAELAIPFVPQFIWPYLSMYVLFLLPLFLLPTASMPQLGRQLIAASLISGVCFLILPAQIGFAREVPADEPYRAIFAKVFSVDRPYNLVPSLHVIFSCAIAMACVDFARPAARIALRVWLVVIVASTVLVHQHHLLDLAAAIPIVFFLRRRYEVIHD